MKTLSLRLDDDLAAKIDRDRGDVPLQRWIVTACRSRLASDGFGPPPPHPDRRAPGFVEPNAVELNTVHVPRLLGPQLVARSSRQSKASVRPIPKGKP